MVTRHSRFWLIPLLALSVPLVHPTPVESQCTAALQPPGTYGTFPSAYIVVRRVLNASYVCQNVAANNQRGCYPTAAQVSAYQTLTASAYTTATNPSCQWQCACATQSPTFTTGTENGLPVELMDFAVEEDVASGTVGESGEDAGSARETTSLRRLALAR